MTVLPSSLAMSLAAAIKEQARSLGFARTGILPVGAARTHEFYEAWIAQGYSGEMGYLARHAEPKRDPGRWMEGARSLICLALPYASSHPAEPVGRASPPARLTPHPPLPEERGRPEPRGRVSRYAWGRDYHEVIGERLESLASFIQQRIEQPLRYRTSVDAQPLMEREWAARAGLGWVGKNAMLINWELGSYLFLAELAVDIELDYDVPAPKSTAQRMPSRFPLGGAERPGTAVHVRPAPGGAPNLHPVDLGLRESCGSCRACIDACPTGAIVADKTIDARRCISYLTIELKGPIPPELRQPMGNWVFGCDICQDVCPWNRHAAETGAAESSLPELAGSESTAFPPLAELLRLDDAEFRVRYRHTPLWRTRRRGLARNAAIALGNAAEQLDSESRAEAIHALQCSLCDPEPVVRGAAAWGLGRFADERARQALEHARGEEADPVVRGEIDAALPTAAVNLE